MLKGGLLGIQFLNGFQVYDHHDPIRFHGLFLGGGLCRGCLFADAPPVCARCCIIAGRAGFAVAGAVSGPLAAWVGEVVIDLLVVTGMTACGLLPCLVAAVWMKAGKTGYTLTLFAILGACLAIAWQASTRLMGVDPAKAIAVALLIFLPATIGCAVGALLGWMLERRRVARFQER